MYNNSYNDQNLGQMAHWKPPQPHLAHMRYVSDLSPTWEILKR